MQGAQVAQMRGETQGVGVGHVESEMPVEMSDSMGLGPGTESQESPASRAQRRSPRVSI